MKVKVQNLKHFDIFNLDWIRHLNFGIWHFILVTLTVGRDEHGDL